MPRKCVVTDCTSNKANAPSYTATFSFPKNNKNQLKEWVKFLRKPNYLPGSFDTICVKHFDIKCLNKFNYDIQKNGNKIIHRTKLCLVHGSIPTIFKAPEIDIELDLPITEPKRKKTSSEKNKEESPPMQNKLQMKQRKKTKAQQMVSSRVNVNLSNENSDSNENESYKVQGSGDDYFLDGLDDMNDLLVINLRLHWLLKTKKNGKLNFSKTPQENDSSYPLLQKVKVMKGLKTEKNPLFWTIEEVYWFIRNISPLPDKGIAKTFRQEEVDGAALVNLKKADLIKYLKVGVPTAQTLAAKIAQLRHETIQKFVNLE